MLALTVKAGDYITIGPDIVIQVMTARPSHIWLSLCSDNLLAHK